MTTRFISIVSAEDKVKRFSIGEKCMAHYILELPCQSMEATFKTGSIFKKIIKSQTEINVGLYFTGYRKTA